ncbi:hypothetical protein Tco_0434984 [Tanacetum coccineum]
MMDSDFIPSDDSLRSDLEVSFPSGTRNKIFDLGIFFEVQSKRFLSQDTFSISFIRNPLVHIEVLSVLWGNRPSIPDSSLPLSRLTIALKRRSISNSNALCLARDSSASFARD